MKKRSLRAWLTLNKRVPQKALYGYSVKCTLAWSNCFGLKHGLSLKADYVLAKTQNLEIDPRNQKPTLGGNGI